MTSAARPAGARLFSLAVTALAVAEPRAARALEPGGEPSAVIVLVGGAGEDPELSAVLTELLLRRSVRARFVREATLRTGQLLAGDAGDRAVWTFVELRGQHEVALYFRGPEARRFLLRRLALRDGLDEIGRELIGQVVESSVQSLLRSSEGLTRDQMTAELSRDDAARATAATRAPAPPVAPAAAVRVAAPPAVAVAVAPEVPTNGRWAGWIAARYTYSWDGPDLGAGHGPGVEIGLERRAAVLLRARVAGERRFTQSVPTTNVDASVQSSPLLLLLDVGRPLSAAQTVTFGLGAGAAITRVTPGVVYDPTVAATAPAWHVAPDVRAELRYEIGGAGWRLTAALLADASVYDTHYDVDRGSTTERAATPWRVRPGAALAVAWVPGAK